MSSRSELVKLYTDQAVQTDPDLTVSLSAVGKDQASYCAKPSNSYPCGDISRSATPGNIQADDIPLGDLLLASEGAYTQLLATEEATIARRSPLSDGKGWVGYNIPSCGYPARQPRVVSLPNPSPPITTVKLTFGMNRIVSMPEHRDLSTEPFKQIASLALRPDSPEIEHHCHDQSSYEQLREHGSRRLYPLDLPRTPSPPSSPDPVIIIDNETRVFDSFHKRSNEDENGWITWTNSPPRPIPALHGPLSLPYARCPSGAEGTLVEGDDLSHKIWGLEVDDSHSNPQRTHQSSRIPKAALQSNSDQTSFARSENIIDLSRHFTFYDPRNSQTSLDIPNSRNSTATYRRSHLPGGSSGRLNLLDGTNSHALNMRNYDPSDAKCGRQRSLGLGLDWQSLLGSANEPTFRPVQSSGQKHLNTAVTPFVPAHHSMGQTYRPVYTRQHANANARQLGAQLALPIPKVSGVRPDCDIPTPPSTASPLWSPVFQRLIGVEAPGKIPFENQWLAAVQEDPVIYSPQTDLDEYSSRIAPLTQHIGITDADVTCEGPVMGHGIDTKATTSIDPEHILKNPSYLAEFTPTIWPSLITFGNQRSEFVEPAQMSETPERRRNLSYQQPRSIPLARLIQRRLSSVPEEDISGSSYDLAVLKDLHVNKYLKKPLPPKDYPHTNKISVSVQDELKEIDANARVKLPPTQHNFEQKHEKENFDDEVPSPAKVKTEPPATGKKSRHRSRNLQQATLIHS